MIEKYNKMTTIILPADPEIKYEGNNSSSSINISYIKWLNILILVRLTKLDKYELTKFGIDVPIYLFNFPTAFNFELQMLDPATDFSKITAFVPDTDDKRRVFKVPFYNIILNDKFRETLHAAFANWMGITSDGFDFPPDYSLIESEVSRINSILRK